MLQKSGGHFFVGSSLTLGDLAVFNHLRLFKEYAEISQYDSKLLDQYPTLANFFSEISQRPAIAAYLKSPKCYPVPPPPEYMQLVDKVLGRL